MAPNFCTKIVFGPSELIDSRSDWSKPRISDGHADDRGDADDDAEHGQRRAHLVGAQRVEGHGDDLAEQRRVA